MPEYPVSTTRLHPTLRHDIKEITGLHTYYLFQVHIGSQVHMMTSSHDGLFTNNIKTASAVLISGNNYSKLKHYADCLGLNFITSSTFHRIQNLYCIPAIEDWWSWMRETILQQLQVQNITLSGDEKCDSPGHSAKYIFVLLLDGLHRLLDCPC